MMPMSWFTSDPHLWHSLVIGLRGFSDADEQVASFKDTWLSRVAEHDTVYVLGDVCLSRLDAALDLFEELPGTKHLIFGNHDAGHPGRKNNPKAAARYYRAFTTAGTAAQVKLNDTMFMLSHFPYDDTSDVRPDLVGRFNAWRLPDVGIPLIHGHTHRTATYSTSRMSTPQIHVGLDAFPQFASRDDVLDVYHSH